MLYILALLSVSNNVADTRGFGTVGNDTNCGRLVPFMLYVCLVPVQFGYISEM